MSYIGVQPTAGQYRQLDDISSGFNGSTTTFTTSVSGDNVTATSPQQLLVSLGGVIQQPNTDYTTSTNSITFTTAPGSGLNFFAVLMGDAVNIGTPADGSVTSVKLASDLTVDLASGTVSAPSLTFDVNTGLFSPGADEVAVSVGGSEAYRVDSSGRLLVGTSSASGSAKLQVAGDITATGDATIGSLNGGPLAGARNRIINGDMRIDQRNGGASVTPTLGQYVLDRWKAVLSQNNKYSTQQNSGAVTPPPGFTNYLGATSLSAYTLVGNDSFSLEQVIEGYNVADLDWGTANAKTATLSFWVRSSLTGTFGGSIATEKTATWVMPFSYSISAANTWTYVTVSITAPTSTGGTNNDNTGGVLVRFGLGASGALAGGTDGTWTSAGNYIQPSGTVSVVSTSGATFYITGVQLEAGSVATPFERRSYGQELSLCQRYYQKYIGVQYRHYVSNVLRIHLPLIVTMRTNPITTKSYSSSLGLNVDNTYAYANSLTIDLQYTGGGTGVVDLGDGTITLTAEL